VTSDPTPTGFDHSVSTFKHFSSGMRLSLETARTANIDADAKFQDEAAQIAGQGNNR
jgi:hypothetical protein